MFDEVEEDHSGHTLLKHYILKVVGEVRVLGTLREARNYVGV